MTAGALGCLLENPAKAADYETDRFLLTSSASYSMVRPNALNNRLDGFAPLEGIMGFHFQLERGLIAPDLSHWIKFSFYTGSASDDAQQSDGSFLHYNQKMTYMSFIPIGITRWYKRSQYIDLGMSLGLGLGFSPSDQVDLSFSDGKPGSSTKLSGGTSFIAETELVGRLWFSKYIAATVTGGASYYGPKLTGSDGSSVTSILAGVYVKFGATFALGGMKGTGKVYVDVLPPMPKVEPKPVPKPVQKPAPKTAPKAAPKATAAPTARKTAPARNPLRR